MIAIQVREIRKYTLLLALLASVCCVLRGQGAKKSLDYFRAKNEVGLNLGSYRSIFVGLYDPRGRFISPFSGLYYRYNQNSFFSVTSALEATALLSTSRCGTCRQNFSDKFSFRNYALLEYVTFTLLNKRKSILKPTFSVGWILRQLHIKNETQHTINENSESGGIAAVSISPALDSRIWGTGPMLRLGLSMKPRKSGLVFSLDTEFRAGSDFRSKITRVNPSESSISTSGLFDGGKFVNWNILSIHLGYEF